jgi:hypothetical protein
MTKKKYSTVLWCSEDYERLHGIFSIVRIEIEYTPRFGDAIGLRLQSCCFQILLFIYTAIKHELGSN